MVLKHEDRVMTIPELSWSYIRLGKYSMHYRHDSTLYNATVTSMFSMFNEVFSSVGINERADGLHVRI